MKIEAYKLADTLEKMAEYYRGLGDTQVNVLSIYVYQHDKASFVECVRTMPRPLSKEHKNDEYHVYYKAPGVVMDVYAPRSSVCTVLVPASEAVYECESLLSADEEVVMQKELDK